MSQVAIIGLESGGKGKAFLSENIPSLKESKPTVFHSEVKAWEVTVGEAAAAIGADFFFFQGPYKPDTTVIIAHCFSKCIKNVGSIAGKIWVAVAELNSTGGIIDEWCKGSDTVPAGGSTHVKANKKGGICMVTDVLGSSGVSINKPAGTYYYGIRTWVDGQTPPTYPVPDSEIQPVDAKAWSVVVGEITAAFGPDITFYGAEPLKPNTDVTIADFVTVVNTGTLPGVIHTKIAELDDVGDEVDEWCKDIQYTLNPQAQVNIATHQIHGWCVAGTIEDAIIINKPAGTYYYGLATWGEDEKPPDYPKPAALASLSTPPSGEGGGFAELVKCFFPRLYKKTLTPRMRSKEMTPRLNALRGIRGRKLGGKVLAKAITVNGVKYREI